MELQGVTHLSGPLARTTGRGDQTAAIERQTRAASALHGAECGIQSIRL